MSDSAKKNKPLDSTDWKILELLQTNARMTYSEIASQVHLTAPAVLKRVQRLEENGIIRAYHAEVDVASLLDLPISVFIQMTCSRGNEKKFEVDIQLFPEITECHLMTSTISYVIRAHVSSVKHLHELLERLGRYGETDSAIVLETVRARVVYNQSRNFM
jgi:Lrp/AsnC family transcriptional regulator, leucine-responsive regulatory protein